MWAGRNELACVIIITIKTLAGYPASLGFPIIMHP